MCSLGKKERDPQVKKDSTGQRFSSVQGALAPVTEGKRVEGASQAHKSLRSTGPSSGSTDQGCVWSLAAVARWLWAPVFDQATSCGHDRCWVPWGGVVQTQVNLQLGSPGNSRAYVSEIAGFWANWVRHFYVESLQALPTSGSRSRDQRKAVISDFQT